MTELETPAFGALLAGTRILRTGGDADILSVRLQPRQIGEGRFFFKLRSSQFRSFAADAIRRGAEYVVLQAGDPGRWKSIVDRPTAIATAIREASPDGIVVLMGKRANGAEVRSGDRQIASNVLRDIADRSTVEALDGADVPAN